MVEIDLERLEKELKEKGLELVRLYSKECPERYTVVVRGDDLGGKGLGELIEKYNLDSIVLEGQEKHEYVKEQT